MIIDLYIHIIEKIEIYIYIKQIIISKYKILSINP